MRRVAGIVAEDSSVRRLLVKQSYPLKTAGEQNCESVRKNAMEEASRIITSDGTVIRTLLDGSTQVIVMCCNDDCQLSVCSSVCNGFLCGQT